MTQEPYSKFRESGQLAGSRVARHNPDALFKPSHSRITGYPRVLMRIFPSIFKVFFVVLFAYLFLFTLELKITLFDAYDYMVMAKYNAGLQSWYPFLQFLRPPLLPALLTPIAILHHFGVSIEAIFTLMHLFSLTISGGFILASYYLFRKGLRPGFAALGAFFLMTQPGFIAYSFETMADIPAGLLMILSVLIYLRYRRTHSSSQLIFLCFVTALGVAMKYPMVLAPMVFIGAKMVLSFVEGKNWRQIIVDRFSWTMGLLSAAMYVVISVISLLPVHGWTLENVYRAVQPYLDHIPTVQKTEESVIANVSFLYAQMTAPLFLLMCAGLLMVWRRKNEFNIVMFMWLTVFLLIASVIGAHYEYRYLFPLIPACYFFCAFAMQELFDYAQKRRRQEKYFSQAAAAILILLMVLPALGFTREIKSLNSGFYQNNLHRKAALASTAGGDFYWFGGLYAMYQKDAPFHVDDPYYKIYHFWLNGINFYTGQRPQRFLRNITTAQANKLKAGDVLAYNPVHELLQTKYLPPPDATPPLSIGTIHPMNFSLESKSANQKIFSHRGRKIILNFNKNNTVNIVISSDTPLTADYFILFKLQTQSEDFSRQTFFPFKKGFIWHVSSDRGYFNDIEGIILLNFEPENFHFMSSGVQSSPP